MVVVSNTCGCFDFDESMTVTATEIGANQNTAVAEGWLEQQQVAVHRECRLCFLKSRTRIIFMANHAPVFSRTQYKLAAEIVVA
jgi:hypothetical protein